MNAIGKISLIGAAGTLAACAGAPAITSQDAGQAYALKVFVQNGCTMSLNDYQTQVQSDYPLIALYPGKRPTDAELEQAQSGAFAEGAPARLIAAGVFVRDPSDPQIVTSTGEGCN